MEAAETLVEGGGSWDEPDDEQDAFLVQELREWSGEKGAPDFASFFLDDSGPSNVCEQSFPASASGNPPKINPRGAEVQLKNLSPADRARFTVSDAKEWEAMLGTKAVRVLTPAESLSVRRRFPDRILSSRMVTT